MCEANFLARFLSVGKIRLHKILWDAILECITGFGSTVLALPLCSMLVGIPTAVPALTIISMIFGAYIVLTNLRYVNAEALCTILVCVLSGMPLGMIFYSFMPESILRRFLGIFVLSIALNKYLGLVRGSKRCPAKPARSVFAADSDNRTRIGKWICRTGAFNIVLLLLGGVVHGAFSSGGPFIVIYAAKKLTDKRAFRATMCSLWFIVNAIITAKNLLIGAVSPQVMVLVAASLPFLCLGIACGTYLFHRVSQKAFEHLVNVGLLMAGIMLLL